MIERQILKNIFVGILILFSENQVLAFSSRLIDGHSNQEVLLSTVIQGVKPGTILVLGEQHGLSVHRDQQVQVIESIKKNGFLTSVGLEFFSYLGQASVDQWKANQLSEEEMLKNVGWGKGISFDFYRQQVLLPDYGREFALALNAPKFLTSKLGKTGLASLTDEERLLMPPQFELGNGKYFSRFKEVAGHHCPLIDNCFAAQSLWDDTMAWKATNFIQSHPDQILVIVVGEFHVQYGGGLPDRLRARGAQSVVTLSLINAEGLSEEETQKLVQPSIDYGDRADYIWISKP